MIEKDVAIIGAGVSGLKLSEMLEKKNIDFITFEHNNAVGKYGNRIINVDVAKRLNLRDDDLFYKVKEMQFVSPSGLVISKKCNDIRGYVTNIGNVEKKIFESIEIKDSIKLECHVKDTDFENMLIKADGVEVKS